MDSKECACAPYKIDMHATSDHYLYCGDYRHKCPNGDVVLKGKNICLPCRIKINELIPAFQYKQCCLLTHPCDFSPEEECYQEYLHWLREDILNKVI